MRNWIKYYHSPFVRYKIKFTHWLGDKLLTYQKIKRGPLSSLQHISSHRHDREPFNNIIPPSNIEVDLYSLIYFDIIFLEDYEKLSVGLSKIINDYKRISLGQYDQNRVHQWIEEAKNVKYGHGWQNVGWFSFKSRKENPLAEIFQSMQIYLHQFVPSFITVLYICKPTQKLKKNFSELINEETKEEINIHRINFKYGITSHSDRPAPLVKEMEIDEFMLNTQKELAKFLRSKINCGFILSRPIKSLEVLSINQSLSIFPNRYTHNTERNKELDSFFDILGKTFFYNDYIYQYYRLYKIEPNKYYSMSNYQMLISQTDYDNAHDKKENDPNDWMYHSLSDHAIILSVLFSLESIYDDLEKKVVNLRNMISSIVLSKKFPNIFTNNLTSVAKKYTETNETNFKYQRIYNEIDFDRLERYYSKDIQDLFRYDYKTEDKVSVFKDFRDLLEMKQKFVYSNLNYLRTYFTDYLTFRYTKSNIRSQRTIIFLTIILTLLTIVLVEQSDLLKEIMEYLKSLFVKVT